MSLVSHSQVVMLRGAMGISKADFATKLRILREAAGLSQDEAARRIHANVRTWNRWESPDDPVVPQINNLGRIAQLFDVDTSFFGITGATDRMRAIEEAVHGNRQMLVEIRAILTEVRSLLLAAVADRGPGPPAELERLLEGDAPTRQGPAPKRTRKAS